MANKNTITTEKSFGKIKEAIEASFQEVVGNKPEGMEVNSDNYRFVDRDSHNQVLLTQDDETIINMKKVSMPIKQQISDRLGETQLSMGVDEDTTSGFNGDTRESSSSESNGYDGDDPHNEVVHKPFTKEQVGYKEAGHRSDRQKKCKNCAHYDNHGNCTIVKGIDPEGVCEEQYADVGFFASGSRIDQEVSELTLAIRGENWEKRLEGNSPMKIISDIKQKFKSWFDDRDINVGE